jgi:hypothetical protein
MGESRVRLPTPPQPKILYLDQWALSNLAKALLPETRERFASERDRAAGAGIWPRLLACIERLVKAGLLVCPPSSVHRLESSLDTRLRDALRRLHLHLSGDSRFVNHEQVKRDQLYASFCAWLDGAETEFPGRDSVLRLRGGWPALLQVGSTYALDAGEVEAVRTVRLSNSGSLQREAEAWASESRTFDERRDEQLAAYGPGYLPVHPLGELYALTRHALAERSVGPERWGSEVERFLHSDAPRATPFAQLASDVLSSIGWLAEHSQGAKVDAGTRDDVQAFATYAPFCDAFTVDRRFAHLLRTAPMAERLPSGLAIFAASELDRLEEWLIGVERTAPPGHFEVVRATYGDDWLEPFASVLDSAVATALPRA